MFQHFLPLSIYILALFSFNEGACVLVSETAADEGGILRFCCCSSGLVLATCEHEISYHEDKEVECRVELNVFVLEVDTIPCPCYDTARDR